MRRSIPGWLKVHPPAWAKLAGAFVFRVLTRFGEHRGYLVAAALAFYAAFAIFPLLLGLVAILAAILPPDRAEHLVLRYAGSVLGQQGGIVASTLKGVSDARGTIGAASALLLVWSARGLFTNLAGALDIVHGFEGPKGWKGQVRRNGEALGYALGCGAMILALTAFYWGIALLNGGGGNSLGASGPLPSWLGIVQNAGAVLGFFAGLVLVYRFLPSGPVPWTEALLSGVLGVALWFPVSLALSFYLTEIARLNAVYGPLSGIMAFYIWLDYTTTLIVLAAEVGATASEWRARPSGGAP